MAYDGTAYKGWQVQPNGTTVQGVLEKALSTLLGQEIQVTGAGRTDTGVHASYYVAHFDIPDAEKEHPSGSLDPADKQFVFRLNRFLPGDMVVYQVQQVPAEMHARFSATYRTYHYHISTVKPLFNRVYAHYLYGKLDTAEIDRCCGVIMETTDFTSFSKLQTDVKTNNCRVMEAAWKTTENGYRFEIRADRFLRNMVRSLVGTLVDVGKGKLDHTDFRRIAEAKDRGKAGQSAPAHALFLVDIGYENISSPLISSPLK